MARAGRLKTALKALLAVLATATLLPLATSAYVALRYRTRLVAADAAPPSDVAVVFGAGLAQNNEPSPILKERMDRAIALYRAGKVKRLLVTGDNEDRYHNETSVMRRYALERGVLAEHLLADPAGFSTYDSCYRAKSVFKVDRAILVTQRFHLPRALYIANSLGLESWGVPAADEPSAAWEYELRELLSRPLAWAMVLAGSPPRSLEPPRAH